MGKMWRKLAAFMGYKLDLSLPDMQLDMLLRDGNHSCHSSLVLRSSLGREHAKYHTGDICSCLLGIHSGFLVKLQVLAGKSLSTAPLSASQFKRSSHSAATAAKQNTEVGWGLACLQ